MPKKIQVGILGPGLIGTDLLIKIMRSDYLECSIVAGLRESEGLKRAKEMGIKTSTESIDAIKDCAIAIDCTTADAHKINGPILKQRGIFTIDMTPSMVGKMCVPAINLKECLKEPNVNLVSCGAQATIPLIYQLENPRYVEVVASIASKSAGLGTRNNIDEYTQRTRDAIEQFCNVKAKAIIILNPAEPPIIMHNTIYAKVDKKPKLDKIIEEMRKFVPGYNLVLKPVFETNRLTFMCEVVGQGDFLPSYAGNLDIINSAAIRIAEEYAKN